MQEDGGNESVYLHLQLFLAVGNYADDVLLYRNSVRLI